MLLAKDVTAVEADFISVLEHIPGTKRQKQAYFLTRGIRAPRTSYESMCTMRPQHDALRTLVAFLAGRERIRVVTCPIAPLHIGFRDYHRARWRNRMRLMAVGAFGNRDGRFRIMRHVSVRTGRFATRRDIARR